MIERLKSLETAARKIKNEIKDRICVPLQDPDQPQSLEEIGFPEEWFDEYKPLSK